jgi:hypothetical protein
MRVHAPRRAPGTKEGQLDDTLQDSVDHDTHDWKASDFGEADYMTEDEVANMVEDVADGSQDEATNADEFGWTLSAEERAALPKVEL